MTLLQWFNPDQFAANEREIDEAIASTDAGLEATDCTGVILGNADLESKWLPRVIPVTPDYVLPGEAHKAALATIEVAK